VAENTEPPRRAIREPRDAELAARDWMRWIGYSDAELTQGGADGGIDVQATGAVAQVKAEAVPVGRPAIQQLYGVAQVEGVTALFFSWGGYSDGAMAWAERAGVALFTLNMIGEVEVVNDTATDLLAGLERESEEGKLRREREEQQRQAELLGMVPFWDEDGPVVARADIWEWIEFARAEPGDQEQCLTVVHRDLDPPDGIPLQHCWMRFVVERGADPAVRFTSWGFDSSDILVAYESLRVPPNGFPLADPGNAFFALEAPWSHHYSTRWDKNLHILMRMIAENSAHAGRPITKRGYWRFDERA
jgi:hypothetical protein